MRSSPNCHESAGRKLKSGERSEERLPQWVQSAALINRGPAVWIESSSCLYEPVRVGAAAGLDLSRGWRSRLAERIKSSSRFQLTREDEVRKVGE
jgi:hypothetical protein